MKRILIDSNFGRIIVLELSKKPSDTIKEIKKQEELISYFLNEYYGNYRYYQKTSEVRSFINLICELFKVSNKSGNIITFPYHADKISKKLYFTVIEDYLTNLLYSANKDIKIHSYVEFFDLRKMVRFLNDNKIELEEIIIDGFEKEDNGPSDIRQSEIIRSYEEEILDPFDKEVDIFSK